MGIMKNMMFNNLVWIKVVSITSFLQSLDFQIGLLIRNSQSEVFTSA